MGFVPWSMTELTVVSRAYGVPGISLATCPPMSMGPPGGPIDMGGQVASDIPGTPYALETTVSSVIDQGTKPIDVYSVNLQAGQTYYFSALLENASTVGTNTFQGSG